MTPTPAWRLLLRPFLCDACDRVRRGVTSPDGRVLCCPVCRVRWHLVYGRRP